MKAAEATTQSVYGTAVRQHNGKPMIYSASARRMFLPTSDPGTPDVFQEVKSEYVDSFLNHADWQAWNHPLPKYEN